ISRFFFLAFLHFLQFSAPVAQTARLRAPAVVSFSLPLVAVFCSLLFVSHFFLQLFLFEFCAVFLVCFLHFSAVSLFPHFSAVVPFLHFSAVVLLLHFCTFLLFRFVFVFLFFLLSY